MIHPVYKHLKTNYVKIQFISQRYKKLYSTLFMLGLSVVLYTEKYSNLWSEWPLGWTTTWLMRQFFTHVPVLQVIWPVKNDCLPSPCKNPACNKRADIFYKACSHNIMCTADFMTDHALHLLQTSQRNETRLCITSHSALINEHLLLCVSSLLTWNRYHWLILPCIVIVLSFLR